MPSIPVNPYLITGPALISFSGGRTSAFMLKQILDAHGGVLPADVHVGFANTGKEREETLRFVHECGSRWAVPIHWLEWRGPKQPFVEVGYNSASREGEPFDALIAWKQALPNWQARWCTTFMKVVPLTEFAASLGWPEGSYLEVIGLRHDEGDRILKSFYNAEWKKQKKGPDVPRVPPRRVFHPLDRARVTKAAVMAFWREQPFDLGLQPYEGNCDVCFMKGRGIKKRIMRDNPAAGTWWAKHEAPDRRGKSKFWDRRDSIAGLAEEIRRAPGMFDGEPADFEYDAECGLTCGADE